MKRLACPHDAFDSPVDVAGENYQVGGDLGQVDRSKLPV
jgi:hypothetical protein